MLQKSTIERKCFVRENLEYEIGSSIRHQVCKYLPVENEYGGHSYCILHLPNKDKDKDKFRKEILARLDVEKYDFRGVWFPYKVDFSNKLFSKFIDFSHAVFTENVDFSTAIFTDQSDFSYAVFGHRLKFHSATFNQKTYFVECLFNEHIDFSDSKFQGVDFTSAIFKQRGEFNYTTFKEYATFRHAKFNENADLIFKNATFENEANFRNTIVSGHLTFEGREEKYLVFSNENSWLSLQNAHIEKPENISFKNVRLRPNWFINIDCRKFIFHDVDWKNSTGNLNRIKVELEEITKRPHIGRPSRILAIACRQLAVNSEENNNFEQASSFRLMANESKRLEDYKGWKVWSLHWWYWLSSFYGESPLRAGLVLAGILLLFAFTFMFTNFQVCPIVKSIPEIPCEPRTLNIWESILQSLATATFQSIEYIKPNSKISTFLIILEKIFAPLQVALLALAIRRKFMR